MWNRFLRAVGQRVHTARYFLGGVGVGLLIFGSVVAFWDYASLERGQNMDLSCRGCNVLVIGFDALQATHVGHLGHTRDTTPTIDRLAEVGVTFTNNYAVASWTVPSFMSYFTSLYPSEHRVTNKFVTFTDDEQKIANLEELSPTVLTVAEAFRQAGYATGGFTGDAGVSAQFGYAKGFDVYTDERAFGSFTRSSAHALRWLDNRDANKPFFMFLHGYDAHGQFSELPANYTSQFGASGSFEITPKRQRDLREEGLQLGELHLAGEEVGDWRSWYDSKIRDADERLRVFLDELRARDLMDNLLIIVVSDHGTEVYDHRRFDHGYSLYNELLHVPMVITWPDRHIGKTVSTQIRSIDLVPTLFDITGIPVDSAWNAQMRGKSLLPVITGESTQDRDVFAATDYRNYTHKRALLRADGWKLIMTLESGARELYDINADSDERHDRALERPDIANELEQELRSYMQSVGESPEDTWEIGCLPVYGDQCVD